MSDLRVDHIILADVANAGVCNVPVPRGVDITDFNADGRLEYDCGGQISSSLYSLSLSTTLIAVTNNTGSTWKAQRLLQVTCRAKSDNRLDMLDDVLITGVADTEVLTYQSSSGKWINA